MTNKGIRIVSLVPSLTHMVCDLGFKNQIVGCTNYCVEPPSLRRTATFIGGTKNPDLNAIECLKPTHILVNEEENRVSDIDSCRLIAPTFSTFIKSPLEVPNLIRDVSNWLGGSEKSEFYADKIDIELHKIEKKIQELGINQGHKKYTYYYLIWKDPYMLAGNETYIEAMLSRIGLVNLAPLESRYPQLSLKYLDKNKPDIIFFSSEPFPFRKRDIDFFYKEFKEYFAHASSIHPPSLMKIDGRFMSWYGTMTESGLKLLQDMAEVIHKK